MTSDAEQRLAKTTPSFSQMMTKRLRQEGAHTKSAHAARMSVVLGMLHNEMWNGLKKCWIRLTD